MDNQLQSQLQLSTAKEKCPVIPLPKNFPVIREPAIGALREAIRKLGLSEDSQEFLKALKTPPPYQGFTL